MAKFPNLLSMTFAGRIEKIKFCDFFTGHGTKVMPTLKHLKLLNKKKMRRMTSSDNCDASEFVLEEVATKKQKYEYKEELDDKDQTSIYKFLHIQSSLRSVRPEVYQAITKMKSMYHMSQSQAGVVVEVGNVLFGRK